MFGSLLAMVVIVYLIYIFVNIIKINKRRKDRLKEVEIVYSIGLKEYNKSLARKLNQSKPSIIS